jgi:broad specificity phosphatase PhoE
MERQAQDDVIALKEIWLIRHGESLAQSGEIDDHVDSELSEHGRQQAMRLQTALSSVAFDRILISPLRRAVQTYEICRVAAPLCQFDSRIIEIDWNPTFYESVAPVTTPETAEPDEQDAWFIPVDTRVAAMIRELLEGPHERVMLFGHYGVFCRFFIHFCGLPPESTFRVNTDNTGISVLGIDDDGSRGIRVWNDASHLQEPAE